MRCQEHTVIRHLAGAAREFTPLGLDMFAVVAGIRVLANNEPGQGGLMDLAADFSFQPLPAVQTAMPNPFPEIASPLGPLAGLAGKWAGRGGTDAETAKPIPDRRRRADRRDPGHG
jgi:hypothetical protein